MPAPSGVLPVGPGSSARAAVDAGDSKHSGTPPQHDAPGSSRPGRNGQISSDRTPKARTALNAVARQMSEGTFTSREDVVVTDGETSERPSSGRSRPASDVSDSPAIAPTPSPAPKAKPAAAAEKAAPKAEPTAEEKAASVKKTKDIGAAKRALALDGWEPEDIDALPEEKLLKIGTHRAKNQADVNREFAKLRSGAPARNADGTFTEKPAEASAQADPPAPAATKEAPAPKLDIDAEIEAMIDGATEEISEPAAKLLKAITAKLQGKIATAGKGTSDMTQAVTNELLMSSGYDLVDAQYPGRLEAEGAFTEVMENFKALVASGRYGQGQISKAWRDAGHMAFGAPDSVQKVQRDMLSRQDAADRGKVDTGKGDKGTPTTTPITNTRDALRMAGQMMANNPNAKREDLAAMIAAKVRGQR